tara:strand:- start:105 stop:461 length:357 start_codon:yes stop_codon:yes gene_type:complete
VIGDTMNVRTKLGLFGLLFVAIALVFTGVNAETKESPQMGCRSIEDFKRVIVDGHKEKLIFRGISARGHVTFIHLNTDTQTWTAAIVKPSDTKTMCLVDAGFTGEIVDSKESIKAFKW